MAACPAPIRLRSTSAVPPPPGSAPTGSSKRNPTRRAGGVRPPRNRRPPDPVNRGRRPRSPRPAGDPPPPDRIVEALLFVGGPPLTPEAVAAAVRGFTPDQFREAIDRLNKAYRAQNRPYSIQPRDGGYVLAVKPGFRGGAGEALRRPPRGPADASRRWTCSAWWRTASR